ncbi:UDP-N-acetylglucosamine 2-epimerase (non-hydrolyzing) [Yinghuangia sp. ASG 101]|uniref:non-hydrolyzing UDP-N-acetylglucosamine 2-epimerase n=1 Tax=Yinghuangia sp. ASG 101 TaxID=2896848 RepID=UPI001E493A1F|nr:UDP-N-acetylglucosamine 2-epimerase (non-hydrolyzing) [Yinghuangia sp. ASG 101]UGQ09526.1 UDP-N-acetylglucosamine 2-epimerase (non-hydrolyzing) [Yinghuangia sp. ASG 101]
MKVISVVGARPQFVKLAPVAEAFRASGYEHRIVHTGQHYDADLSDVFFADLRIPAPDVHLGIGSGGHGAQTGAMLAALDDVLTEGTPPDWVLVYGDTNSTLAAALSAVKLHLPLAHLEAGLRSYNRVMPEEHNRVLTDHAADLLLAPTELAVRNLTGEGLAARTLMVGDVMTDILLRVRAAVADRPFRLPGEDHDPAVPGDGPDGPGYLLATVHRAENTDDPKRLRAIVEGLAALPLPVLLLAHPRLRAKAEAAGIDLTAGALRVARPLPYPEMVRAVLGSSGVVTDSGGLQKEVFLLRRPCTTLRTETEWPETLEGGWNHLCADPADLVGAVLRESPTPVEGHPYGDGHAAEKVVAALAERA